MSAKKVVTTYAKSLFQNVNSLKPSSAAFAVSKVTAVDQKVFVPTVYILGEELSLIRSTIVSSKKLKEFFTNPTCAEKLKLDVILSIFPGLTIKMRAFLRFLTERNHLSLIPEIYDEYTEILLKFKNCKKVKIITASALKKGSSHGLHKALKQLTNSKEIILSLTYDASLIGGLIIEYGSSSIDGSISKEFRGIFDSL
jgi:F-type H+-transporting ATPase subunit delta